MKYASGRTGVEKKYFGKDLLKKPYVALVFIIGITLSTVLYKEIGFWEHTKYELEFQENANNLAATLQSGINERIAALEIMLMWINAEMHSGLYEEMDAFQIEYNIIGEHLTDKYKSIGMIGLFPRISAKDKTKFENSVRKTGIANFTIRRIEESPESSMADYYPLYLSIPREASKPSEGFDFASKPTFGETMNGSRLRNGLYSTPPVESGSGVTKEGRVYVFGPLFKQSGPGSANNSSDEFMGYVGAMFNVKTLVTSSFSGIDFGGIGVHIYYMGDPAGSLESRLIFEKAPVGSESQAQFRAGDYFSKTSLVRNIDVAGRHWSALFVPTREYVAKENDWRALLALGGGLTVTLLLTWHLYGLVRKNEEVERLVAQRTAELAHANRLSVLGEMAAGIAHEINQPLTGIMNYAEIAREYLDKEPVQDAKARESLGKILEQARRGKGFIKDLKTFAASADSSVSKVDVNRLVEMAVEMLSRTADSSGVIITRSLDTDLPSILGSHLRLEQSLLNILNNAIESIDGKKGGEVRIITKKLEAGRIAVTVADNGCGFGPETARRIFDPFFTTKNKKEGCGLGLSISSRIINDHGGTLTAKSEPGEGSEFTIILNSNGAKNE